MVDESTEKDGDNVQATNSPHNSEADAIVDTAKVKFADDAKGDAVATVVADGSKAKEAQQMLGNMSEMEPAKRRQFRVYPRRWIVLATVALLNNSNTMVWISFASVANHCDSFYKKEKAANWFSLVYMMFTIPVGVFAMWMGSRFGIRTAILTAAWFQAVGAALRLLSSFLPVLFRFPVGILGQGIAACAYPFIMFLPTKVAGTWFGENERTVATTIGVMSNPLGVLVANIVAPQVVPKPSHIPILNVIVFVPTVVACVIAMFGVTSSEPKTPPTLSAAKEQMAFIEGVKACFSNRMYLMLVVVLGGGIGMFNCLYTIIQQLLCPSGYTNTFSGICASLMIVGGVCGAASSGIVVDRTKLYVETMKVALSFAVVFGLLFLQLTLHPNLEILIAVSCVLFGVFGLASYPVGLEISSEITFPVSETTSTGIVVLSGQIQSVLYLFLISKTSRKLQPDYMHLQTCNIGEDSKEVIPMDNTYPIIVFSFVAAFLALLLTIGFRPTLKRLIAEQGIKGIQSEKGGLDQGRQLDERGVRLPKSDGANEPLTQLTDA